MMDVEDALAVDINEMFGALSQAQGPRQVTIDPDNVARDVSRLVLTLAEFLRQLMEAQAIRRMDAGSLTEEQEERLGNALFEAREQIRAIAGQFELSEEDLRLELGPLGRLV